MSDKDSIFHIHTYRCGHAGDERETAYIKKAVELGAKEICFSDHCPFPGNPFGGRMDLSELDDYVRVLQGLKKEFHGVIDIKIGLEVEFLESFCWFYEDLKRSGDFDFLMLGQHFFEHREGCYSFSDKDKSREHEGLMESLVKGMSTGYFDVVAHPDRCFRRLKKWNEGAARISEGFFEAALSNGIILEKNIASMGRKHHYWPEFWEMMPEGIPVIVGVDAHSVNEMAVRSGRSAIRNAELGM